MKRISVVISQGQSQNPTKRQLEEELIMALMIEPGIDVTVVPNLYDLKTESTALVALQGITDNLIVVSWLYSRAAHWLLDRNDIRGQEGTVLLTYGDEDEDQDDEPPEESSDADRVVDQRPVPTRRVYCLDFRASTTTDDFVKEIKRIHSETSAQVVDLMNWVDGTPSEDALKRFQNPTNSTALDHPSATTAEETSDLSKSNSPLDAVRRIDAEGGRRWYPVIDFSRCTNCMECIDFCLFGVYGIDGQETILVEQPDNCRKGCPACSRVCPENAIIFPQHKTPAIAGADLAVGGLKIDLSKLFGAPEKKENAVEAAARERDEQLMLAGRDVVGLDVGIAKRHTDQPDPAERDDLDDLIDELEDFDV